MESDLASAIALDLNQIDADQFRTPEKRIGQQLASPIAPLPADEFLPLSQKFSLSPLNDEELSISASELLYSELSDQKELLVKAQQEARDYKLKCEALLSTLTESKKRQREEARAELARANEVRPDEAPKKKPSPEPKPNAVPKPTKAPVPVVQPAAKAAPRPPVPTASVACHSDDDVPAPDPQPVKLDFEFKKPYETLHSILCAYKAKQIIPGSTELPFDLCASMCKEEADNVKKWSPDTCATYHKALISALKLVYPNKVKSWFDKPFLRNPTSTAVYWARVLTRRSEIWQAAADRRAATTLPPPHQEPLKDRIRRRIAERKAERLNSLSVSFRSSKARSFSSPPPKASVSLSSDSDEPSATVIDLSQSPAASSSSNTSPASSDSPPKAAPHPK